MDILSFSNTYIITYYMRSHRLKSGSLIFLIYVSLETLSLHELSKYSDTLVTCNIVLLFNCSNTHYIIRIIDKQF